MAVHTWSNRMNDDVSVQCFLSNYKLTELISLYMTLVVAYETDWKRPELISLYMTLVVAYETCLNPRYMICSSLRLNLVSWQRASRPSGLYRTISVSTLSSSGSTINNYMHTSDSRSQSIVCNTPPSPTTILVSYQSAFAQMYYKP